MAPTPDSQPFASVSGTFYRAIDPAFREHALDGARSAGRYNRPGRRTLYLSGSRDGVAAAMIAHTDATTPEREILEISVRADRIVDLRDPEVGTRFGFDPADAAADWQHLLDDRGRPRMTAPPSWRVRDLLESAGAHGLIDPSRKAPGLWHLVLFDWNSGSGSPHVEAL